MSEFASEEPMEWSQYGGGGGPGGGGAGGGGEPPTGPFAALPGVPPGARCAVHPEREAIYVCGRCGNFICSQCTQLGQLGDIWCAACEEHAPSGIPWEERKTLGVPRAFWETLKETLVAPTTFFARRPREPATLPALLYGFSFTFIVGIATALYDILVDSGAQAELAANPIFHDYAWIASPAFQLGTVVVSPITYLISVYASSGMWWLSLKVVGAANKPFNRIVRALAYSNGVSIFGAIPVIGLFIAIIWSAVLQVIAMWRTQDTDLWRAIVAFVVLVMFFVVIACVACAVPMFALLSAAGGLQ